MRFVCLKHVRARHRARALAQAPSLSAQHHPRCSHHALPARVRQRAMRDACACMHARTCVHAHLLNSPAAMCEHTTAVPRGCAPNPAARIVRTLALALRCPEHRQRCIANTCSPRRCTQTSCQRTAKSRRPTRNRKQLTRAPPHGPQPQPIHKATNTDSARQQQARLFFCRRPHNVLPKAHLL